MVERTLQLELHDPAEFADMSVAEIERLVTHETPALVRVEDTPDGPSEDLMRLIGKLPSSISFFISELTVTADSRQVGYVGELWPRNTRPY